MKPLLAIAVLLVLLVSCATSGNDDIRALYNQRDAMVMKRDVEGLLDQSTPDYTIRLENGQTMTREQLRERWTFYYDKVLIRHVKFSNEIRSVVRRGNDAVVTVEQKDHRIQNGRDGKPAEIEANVIHTDTWTHTPGGWKLRLTEEGDQTKFTIDGKAQPIN